MSIFKELKRRNVFRVGLAYVVGAWVLLQIIDFVLDAISAPNWIVQVFILAAAVGFPVVLIFSWVFELTSEGIKRESEIDQSQSITPNTGRKLDRVIIAFLAVAVIILLADRFIEEGPEEGAPSLPSVTELDVAGGDQEKTQTTSSDIGGKSIAVLPFVAMSSGEDDEYFADGLTEEILNSLSQLPELLVTARTSAFHFKGQDIPLQEIAATLGVKNIVEGSVRRAGERLRVTAQLIRAEDGFHLWSENYDSTSEDTIAVQEDIAEKIALAMDVVMDEAKREGMRKAGLRDVESFIALQKGLELHDKAHGDMEQIEGLRQANRYIETVTEKVPGYASAYLLHSDLYVHMLLNDATSYPMTGVTEQDLAQAMDHVTSDYAAAVKYAQTTEGRDMAELDLAFLTSNWRGLKGRIEVYLNETGCDQGNWPEPITAIFGYAAQMRVRSREFRDCDPLYSTAWWSEANIALWAGDPADSVEVARQGLQTAPGASLNLSLVRALAANGQLEQARMEINSRIQISIDAVVARILIAAVAGEQERLSLLFDEYQQDPEASDYWRLPINAWSGEKAEANRLAAKIDQHPFGNVALTLIAFQCACGAPWDLDHTPNFATVLEEASLPWPPAPIFKFPLKDW